MSKIYSVWMPVRGEPAERGKGPAAFCSSACAEKAGAQAMRVRWAPYQDDTVNCFQCGRPLAEVPPRTLEMEEHRQKSAPRRRKRKES
jgi:hypothetical protein